jgi:bifunctional non-homologous end joining protein LigD
MQRFPNGVGAAGFYEKRVPGHAPAWLPRVRVRAGDGHQDQVAIDNRATLAWLANQACITPHVWGSRARDLDRPDVMVFDLDPAKDDFEAVRAAAFRLRDLLGELDLPSWPSTTGSKGVHVVVPVDGSADFDVVRAFARGVAETLRARHPQTLTTAVRKARRGGRRFLDVGRNAYGQTRVAPYAVRAREGAPVATPITWAELEDRALDARTFRVGDLARRLEGPDPWRGMARRASSLVSRAERLEALKGV